MRIYKWPDRDAQTSLANMEVEIRISRAVCPPMFIVALFTVSKRKTTFMSIDCCCLSVARSCPTPCDPMDCSTPGFPVHHQFPEIAQTHVH